ncbi:MAG: MarR family transcriptional regulator, partial [Egicoccus sp.]
MSDVSVAALESALTRLIRRALLPTSGDETRAAAGVTLDRAAYHVLLRICDQGGMRLSALAEAMGLDVSTVSRHVTRLEQDGYVTRSPDPDDGRASLLTTTEAGRAVGAPVRET